LTPKSTTLNDSALLKQGVLLIVVLQIKEKDVFAVITLHDMRFGLEIETRQNVGVKGWSIALHCITRRPIICYSRLYHHCFHHVGDTMS